MSDDLFTHDPTASRSIPGDVPTLYEKAKAALDNSEAEGLGFVVTRHDPLLVLEIVNGQSNGDLAPCVEPILSALGPTFTEVDDGLLRLFYRGALPGELHGCDPVVVTVGGEDHNHVFRLFDSGWTPVTGQHIQGMPEDVESINNDALHQFLSKSGKI